jgi:uncharacterized protein YodC (DUF2158 family)
MKFKVGDIVQLKSGGPLMTIESAQDDGTYWCVWFSSKGDETKGGAFKAEMLVEA